MSSLFPFFLPPGHAMEGGPGEESVIKVPRYRWSLVGKRDFLWQKLAVEV